MSSTVLPPSPRLPQLPMPPTYGWQAQEVDFKERGILYGLPFLATTLEGIMPQRLPDPIVGSRPSAQESQQLFDAAEAVQRRVHNMPPLFKYGAKAAEFTRLAKVWSWFKLGAVAFAALAALGGLAGAIASFADDKMGLAMAIAVCFNTMLQFIQEVEKLFQGPTPTSLGYDTI